MPPLSGIRVIELAHIMAGPVCGLMLGDMGADVVKVERLPGGDGSRAFLPPDVRGESAAFMMLNRGKRGLALDLRSEEGRTLVRRLVSGADVIIENFRTGTMERMGLGFEALSTLNPRLVYCQITGYGRTGPLSHQGGFDLIAQGYSGLMSVTGEAPGRAPVKVGAPVTDITAGILAAFGVAVCAQVKSNCVVIVQPTETGFATVGIGPGQTSRVEAVRIAARRAGDRARGALLVSDAFFPFRDGIDTAHEIGITTVVHPGGSIRDAEVIEAANEHGMAMLFTGVRLFRH